MILPPPAKEDFAMDKDIRVDTENKGFSSEEMGQLSETAGEAGAKGIGDWWTKVWGQGRVVAPEIGELKSEFGYQTQPIITDLLDVAAAQNTPLEGVIKARSAHYNFYMMRCGVYIAPENDETFEALKFQVKYKDDKTSTHSMLPGPQTEKLFGVSTKADVGVTGKIDFGLPPIPLHAVSIEAAAKAELEAKFIVAFEYELKTQVVDSFGVGNSFCKWFMHKGANLRNDVVFYPIIMTPKATKSFDCEFHAYFKISHPHWKQAEFFLKPPKTITVSV